MKSCKYKAGITLIEMLIVVAVLSLLTSILIAAAARIYNQSKEQLTKNTFALLDAALQEFHDFTSDFPIYQDAPSLVERSEILYGALNSIPSSRRILEKISDSLIENNPGTADMPEIYDPWGTVVDYRYRYVSEDDKDTFPKLTSAGPDRQFGTPGEPGDDITNR